MEPINFLLNKSSNTKDRGGVVDAPAFSLTKVMAVLAPVITGLATVVINWIKKKDFTPDQLMVIIVALVAFLAITGAADVIARGIAASAKLTSDSTTAAAQARLRMTPLGTTVKAQLHQDGRDKDVTVVAISDGRPAEFLCYDADGALTWNPVDELTLKG
jgi:hypothetical protein